MSNPNPVNEPTVILDAPSFPGAVGVGYTLKVAEAQNEDLVGKEFHLDRPCLIGRVSECDVVLVDASVSRKHARIEFMNGKHVVVDQNSANGTWVGDRRVMDAALDQLDRFRIGQVVLEYRRDDEAGDELEFARTTSIPIPSILEGIQHSIVEKAGRLEDEGELVSMAGNKPFFLSDPTLFWLVEAGRVEIFTVPRKEDEAAGARTHFVTVEEGQALFGMDLDAYGIGSGFLVSGKGGTKLRKIPIERIRQLAALPVHAARITPLFEGWVSMLTKALARDIPPGPPPDVDLVEGKEATVDFQKRARAPKGLLFVEVPSSALLFIGLSEVGFSQDRVLFPVSRDGWVESTEDGLKLKPVAAGASILRAEIWDGLAVFHQVLCECEFLNKKLAQADEFNRLRNKAEQAVIAKEAAYQEIGGVMAAEQKKDRVEIGDVEPVYLACRHVCTDLGMEAKRPPEPNPEWSFEDNLQAVAVASRFRTRQVALRGDWWHFDQGPILAQIEATKAAVALVPTSPRSYEWVEPKTGTRTPVDAEFAQTLKPFGFVFYRRFKDGLLTVKDVVKFGSRGLKSEIGTLVAMAVAMGVLGMMTPYFMGRMFDTAIPQAERGLLTQFATALLVAAVASAAFKLTQSIAVLRLQGKMDYSIQAALWDRLLDLPSTFFRRFSAGDLTDRAQGIDAIRHLVAGAGVGAILGALSSVFYVIQMMTYNIPLALLGIALTIVFVSFTTVANFLQLRLQRSQMEIKGKITGLVIQLISGVPKLRVSGTEHHGFRVWAKEFAEQRRITFRAGRIQSVVQVFNASYPILSSMAIFYVLVKVQTSAAEQGATSSITTGDFIAFNTSFSLFLAAMQALSDASLSLLKAVPIWERLVPILTTPAEIDESKLAPNRLKGDIEVSHVSFRYNEDSPWILKDVSLKINPGEFVAFVGGSGCGKSTLMRLLLGFEKPEKGTILYDGQDLSGLDIRLVRQQMGVVLQESRVLPADIYRNIVGTSSRTLDEAWEAAESSGFADDIRNMPMGMHTYVSEGGGGFSGGQRQRLMIARSVVNKPKIIFLDEATSALDNRTQAKVTESMDKMHATRVVIAHRLSTIENADRIYYFDAGQIKESGTYDELMKKSGLFAELARRQTA